MKNIWFVATMLFGCSEAELNQLKDPNGDNGARLEVSPTALDFGTLGAEDEPSVRTFTLTSVGSGDVTVEDILLEGEMIASYTLINPISDMILAPGESIDLQVSFDPIEAHEIVAEAVVYSNDYENPVVPVTLVGQGAVPDLLITPDPLNFGATYVGCNMQNQVTLTNIGSELLTIYNVTHTGEPFTMDNLPIFPVDLLPNEEMSIAMTFTPEEDVLSEGFMDVISNDPDGTLKANQSGIGQYIATYEQYWENPVDPPSDIIFSVDQSCSMYDDAALLGSSFSTFINQLSNYSTDWQIMVANQDNGCTNSGILTPNTGGFQSYFNSAVTDYSSGGSYTESLLTVVRNAVENTDAGECNSGFLRANAMLHIIMVSDEPEQSGGNYSSFINDIIAKKGNSESVRMSAIVEETSGRYVNAVNDTGGLLFSIYNGNWSSSNNLQLLAEASIIADKYDLDHPAVESTIEVFVNGYQVNANWTYDTAQNAVIFDTNPPSEGDNIRIVYATPATCD
jgi:hypothetical protein